MLPVRENELPDFGKRDWRRLQTAGLEVIDLDGAEVIKAVQLRAQHTKLTAEDCFSLVMAQDLNETIFLTSDAALRQVAAKVFRLTAGEILEIAGIGSATAGQVDQRPLPSWRPKKKGESFPLSEISFILNI